MSQRHRRRRPDGTRYDDIAYTALCHGTHACSGNGRGAKSTAKSFRARKYYFYPKPSDVLSYDITPLRTTTMTSSLARAKTDSKSERPRQQRYFVDVRIRQRRDIENDISLSSDIRYRVHTITVPLFLNFVNSQNTARWQTLDFFYYFSTRSFFKFCTLATKMKKIRT